MSKRGLEQVSGVSLSMDTVYSRTAPAWSSPPPQLVLPTCCDGTLTRLEMAVLLHFCADHLDHLGQMKCPGETAHEQAP